MKFTINQDALSSALGAVHGACNKRSHVPVYSHVLFRARGNELSVTCNNTELQLTSRAEASIETEGEACIPDRIFDLAKALASGSDVTIELRGTVAHVRCGRGRYTLQTLPAQDFPVRDGSGEWITILGLPALLSCVSTAMANQDVRYYLNCALIDAQDGKLNVVATDGHRLSLASAETKETARALIPSKSVQAMVRAECQALRIFDGGLEGRGHNVEIITSLIDGKFPNYRTVVPEPSSDPCVVDAEAFAEAVGRAKILANEKWKAVKLTMSENEIAIIGNTETGDEAVEIVDAQCRKSVTSGFNANYLLDAIAAVEAKTIELHQRDAQSPLLILGAEGRKAVVMPMRV